MVVAYLVRKAVEARGEDYLSYPQHHLFDKIGSRGMVLETDPYGNFVITGYDLGPARDWVRFGMLYLQGGTWNGEQLLPDHWTDFVRTPAPAWKDGAYGASFWLPPPSKWPLPPDAYSMEGSGGQYTFIIPTHDLVVVRMGHDAGQLLGDAGLERALSLLLKAVPQVRPPWIGR